jgi:hypothetical protein
MSRTRRNYNKVGGLHWRGWWHPFIDWGRHQFVAWGRKRRKGERLEREKLLQLLRREEEGGRREGQVGERESHSASSSSLRYS